MGESVNAFVNRAIDETMIRDQEKAQAKPDDLPLISEKEELPMRKVYPALLSPTESGGFFVRVPDVNGCVTTGKTQEEALDNIRDALAGCLCVLEDVGKPLPEPSAPAAVDDGKSTVVMVDVDLLEYRKETEAK